MKWKYEKFVGLFTDVSNRRIWFKYFSKPPFPLDIFWRVLEIAYNFSLKNDDYGNPESKEVFDNDVLCSYSDIRDYIVEVFFRKKKKRIYFYYYYTNLEGERDKKGFVFYI